MRSFLLGGRHLFYFFFNFNFLLLSCIFFTLCPFLFVLTKVFYFDYNFHQLQFESHFMFSFLSLNFGVDAYSLCLVLLTVFVFPLCFYACLGFLVIEVRWFLLVVLFFLEVCCLLAFVTTDIFLFYIFFEATLIPMFLLIGKGGSRFRKTKAAFYLFFYTFCGSIFMFLGLLLVYQVAGGFSFSLLRICTLSFSHQVVLWLFFFFTFSVKIPMLPFHIWLPEAHVEAPTVGSIILASILLKLGGYGFIRVLLEFFPKASLYFLPFVLCLSLIGVIYASFSTLRQIDIKRVIAYSSIAHMNMAVLGVFVYNVYGVLGALYLMLGHGLISGALFFSVGVLYDRYHTRILFYYGGLFTVMPIYSFFFLFLSFSNVGFPGTFNFISELLVFLSCFSVNFVLFLFLFFGFVLAVVYSIWLYNRVMLGTIKTVYFSKFSDLNLLEFLVLSFCSFFIVFFGIFSSSIFGFFS